MTVKVFISYCHLDDVHRVEIDKHLAPMKRRKDVEIWFDGDIHPGQNVGRNIAAALKEADIIVALASHNYLNSRYCFEKEYSPSLRRAKRGELHLLVAMVGTCDWKHTDMANYKILPKDAKPVDQYGNRNKAYVEIIDGIRSVVGVVKRANKAAATTKPVEPKKPLPKTKTPKPAAASRTPASTRVPSAKHAASPPSPVPAKRAKAPSARSRHVAADIARPAASKTKTSKGRASKTSSPAKRREVRNNPL